MVVAALGVLTWTAAESRAAVGQGAGLWRTLPTRDRDRAAGKLTWKERAAEILEVRARLGNLSTKRRNKERKEGEREKSNVRCQNSLLLRVLFLCLCFDENVGTFFSGGAVNDLLFITGWLFSFS